jgi:two-component system nitrate/nitrite response regulator NarL
MALKERFPHIRIVLSVEEFSIDRVTQALEQGIDGLLTDDMSCDQIAASLRLIAMGERVVSSVILKQLLKHQRVRPTIDEQSVGAALSSRELEILKCLVAGDANKVISRRLGITDATVKVHVKSILRKLNVANRTQAAIWAVVRGLSRLEIVTRSAQS